MTFLWPMLLWLLLAVPLLAIVYATIARRRRQRTLVYSGLGYGAPPVDSAAAAAMGAGSGAGQVPGGRQSRTPWARRMVPFVLFLLALAALFAAAARPSAVVMVPRLNQTILLALDSSLSMRASDVKPSRLEALQSAARSFIEAQPADTKIGIVTFAATAAVVQTPTVVREDAIAAIERMKLQKGTAIGGAILVALGVIFPDADFEQRLSRPGGQGGGRDRHGAASGSPGSSTPSAEKPRPEPVPPGSYASAAIVVVTDGQSTVGPPPAEVAKLAAEQGVRVYTIGVGTAGGEVIEGDGWKVRVKLDEAVLKDVATQTRGEYHLAESASALNRIYRELGTRFVLEKKETEITSWFTAAGALLTMVAAALSLMRFNRIL
jgi:Ca-activated chloride channel family protein